MKDQEDQDQVKTMNEKKNSTGFESSWSSITSRLSEVSGKYADILTSDSIYRAFSRAGGYLANQPQIQNQRIKSISTLPADYTKEKIVDFLRNPYISEKPLRETSGILRYTAYPFYKIIKTYQDIPSYKYYYAPKYLTKEEAETSEYSREEILIDKFNSTMCPEIYAHKIVGQAVLNGKVFYTARYRIDKSHNSVDYAMLQQLPQDWCSIIGYNNVSGYTVSFDMMYFMTPGSSVDAFEFTAD